MQNREAIPASDYMNALMPTLSPTVYAAPGLLLGVILVRSERDQEWFVGLGAATLLLFGSPIVLRALQGHDVGTQFVEARLTRDVSIVLVFGMLRMWLAWWRKGKAGLDYSSGASVVGTASFTAISVSIALFLLAVATGFGSGHSLVRQASLAGGLLIAAMIALSVGLPTPRLRRVTLAATALLLALTIPAHVVGNREAPHRMAPLAEQTEPTVLGVAGSKLLLDPATALMFDSLRRAASDAGWLPGTPLISVASQWSSTIPWALAADVPDALMLTLGGYGDASEQLLDFNLQWALSERFEDAWVLVSAEDHERRDESMRWAKLSTAAVGRAFPEDYRRVFMNSSDVDARWIRSHGGVELWRPMAADSG